MGTTYNSRSRAFRGLTLALALCLFLSILPPVPLRAASASALSAMEQLDQWGVLKGYPGGSMQPDRPVTRAEFVAMMNRAYGFTDMSNPKNFSDVPADAWYADEFAIASTAGYFKGTSGNTASPNNRLSREDAMVLLAKCMRLEQVAGEVTEFTDGRTFGSWSRGYVKAAVKQGIIKGYSDGSFRPKNAITRGEMSQLLVRSVGTLVNGGGEQSLGDVYGTVTLNQPGTVLKDTRIAGNLYITGGLGTGAVTLDNVVVTGKIIIAGGGEAEAGQDSVILRNVEAENLTVDSTNGQYVSLRAEGDTSIKDALLRTNAFVQDRTDAGYGLLNLTLNGRTDDPQFSLSGNLKNIVNLTPDSAVNISAGTAQSFVVDETATGSTLNIGIDATVRDLNLDAATNVTGSGDLGKVTVGANGSTITMLPDVIDVRPGVTANIYGQNMDTKLGLESSADPRILASYPIMRQVAPTSAQAVFSCNKAGTLYWAVSAVNDGTLTEDELITPAAYASKAVKQGNLKVSNANAEIAAAISGLTKGGTYYLSAMLVDNRGTRSPIKVASFGTPDDTVPNFAQGFPVFSKITHNAVQLGAMTTKNCLLYYVVLPKGSAAPTVADFKSSAIPGHLGFGYREMTKNTAEYFYLESPREGLEELAEYDVYLWLTDADGAKSSAVKKLSFKTVDGTPPFFTSDLSVLSPKPTALECNAAINEDGTIYWVAVKAGTDYPKPQAGATEAPKLSSYEAKSAVANGKGIGNSGKNGKVNAKAEADTKINISGLVSETSYDIYYVAQDKAGNFSEVVKVLYNAHTLDTTGPTVTQRFHHTTDDGSKPFADTTVDIVFSETVRDQNEPNSELMALFADVQTATPAEEAAARIALATVLSKTIQLYSTTDRRNPIPTRAYDETTNDPVEKEDWVIDYRNAEVLMDDADDTDGRRMIVRFYGEEEGDHLQGIKLKSGASYYFRVQGLEDTSDNYNDIRNQNLPTFTTVSALAELEPLQLTGNIQTSEGELKYEDIDIAFTMTPISASTVEDTIHWDMLLWFDSTVAFDLYCREPGSETFNKVNASSYQIPPGSTNFRGVSLYRGLKTDQRTNPILNQLQDETEYEYVIHISRFGDMDESTRNSWIGEVKFNAQVVTGSDLVLGNQAASMNNYSLIEGVTDISDPHDFPILKKFSDTTAPSFNPGFPKVTNIKDRTAKLEVQLDRPGVVHAILAPVGEQRTWDLNKQDVRYDNDDIPLCVGNTLSQPNGIFRLLEPSNIAVVDPQNYFDTTNPDSNLIILDDMNVSRNSAYVDLKNLLPDTEYFLYIVLQGQNGGAMSEHAMLYRFKTEEEAPFLIELDIANPVVYIAPSQNAVVDYALVRYEASSLDARFSQPLADHLKDGQDPSAIDKSLTVLDSMNRDVIVGGASIGSMFDVYADPAFKEWAAQYIGSLQAGSSTDIVGSGRKVNIDISRTERLPVDCSQWSLSPGVEYIFLTAGRVDGDPTSTPAFRSIYPVYVGDDQPPVVLSISPAFIPDSSLDDQVNVEIRFDDPLYYYDTTQSPSRARGIDLGPLTRFESQTDFVSIEYMAASLSGSLRLYTDEKRIGQNTSLIYVEVVNLSPSTSSTGFTFYPNICDQYKNNRSSPALSIDFKREQNAEGVWGYRVIVPRDWDGTTDKRYSD